MKLNIHEIEEAPKHLDFDRPLAGLNSRLVHGGVCDFEFPGSASIGLNYYRSGLELFFHGKVRAPVVGHCARCVEPYSFDIQTDFHAVLVPQSDPTKSKDEDDEIELGRYSGDEVDIGPTIDEHVILALPTRPLCGEGCKGLCVRCGANLNQAACGCPQGPVDPRLAVLRDLKVGR